MIDEGNVKQCVEKWLRDVVVGLVLCPFAKAPLQKNQIRLQVSQAKNETQLNQELINECQYLDNHKDTETTLLICPNQLDDFFDFCQFISWAESTLKQNQWEGTYQIAHFHPDYCFAGIEADDPQNLTNRAPFPILHIIRESSLEKILNSYDAPENIPEQNIEKMNTLSEEEKRQYFYYLFNH